MEQDLGITASAAFLLTCSYAVPPRQDSFFLVNARDWLALKELCLSEVASVVGLVGAFGSCAAIPTERNRPQMNSWRNSQSFCVRALCVKPVRNHL